MKYAIISDVHGNLNALSAVLRDAAKCKADRYIFVGDYASCMPYPNEVVQKVRQLDDAIAIQGNEDGCLAQYAKQDQNTWTDGQFQAHYWLYNALDRANRDYLLSLPKIAVFADAGTNITVTHKSSDLYGEIEYLEFTSLKVAERYQKDSLYTREKLLQDIDEHLNQEKFAAIMQNLSDGIYIFGHTHVQWNARVGNKIFLNPGSCGLPLDGMTSPSYTLLTVAENGIDVAERRVAYDSDRLLAHFKESGLFRAAPVWSGIVLQELGSGFEEAIPFLRFANEYADRKNDPVRPFSVETWSEAYDAWRAKKS